jgi:hypothetical protein
MKRHSNGDSGDKCEFFCNLSGKKMPLPHFWEHMVGSGHATLALRADWQRRLWQCHEELGFRHVRFHRVLCDDVGTVVEEQGKRLYSFFNLDQIFDFLLSIRIKPFVELSFMPKALASGKTTVFHYNANVTPAAEYDHWDERIDKLAAHLMQRYGANSLRDWFFEVWNEPNMKSFWTGTQEEYFKLYRHTAKALKAVDNSLKVGGAGNREESMDRGISRFLPKDFVASKFHQHPPISHRTPSAAPETIPRNNWPKANGAFSAKRLRIPFARRAESRSITRSGTVRRIPSFPAGKTGYWISKRHYGLAQGPVVVMVENYRWGLIWRLMRDCPWVVAGQRRAGFKSGWM